MLSITNTSDYSHTSLHRYAQPILDFSSFMAKTHSNTLQSNYSKPNFSRFLCCFGSFYRKNYIPKSESDNPKEKSCRSWISWRRRMKNSAIKTVPIEASVSELQTKRRTNKLHSSKSKSKSNLHHSSLDTQIPPPNLGSPTHTPPKALVVAVEPSQTPPQVRIGQRPEQNVSGNLENREHSNGVDCQEDDMRKQSSSSPSRTVPAISHSCSTSKLQVRNLPSFVRPQTTSKRQKRAEPTMRSFDPLAGMSVVIVTLMIMILSGRLCAIIWTTAWLYVVSRFKTKAENDGKKLNPNLNDLDLDSTDYKKRVVLEGLIEREKHRATTS